jgi:hypothetical protein
MPVSSERTAPADAAADHLVSQETEPALVVGVVLIRLAS